MRSAKISSWFTAPCKGRRQRTNVTDHHEGTNSRRPGSIGQSVSRSGANAESAEGELGLQNRAPRVSFCTFIRSRDWAVRMSCYVTYGTRSDQEGRPVFDVVRVKPKNITKPIMARGAAANMA